VPPESFENFCCWDSGSVQETLLTNIGHLGLDEDAVFLAAHSEIPLDQKKGLNVDRTERGVLAALEHEIDRNDRADNSLIAVIGEAGSGKSHLVRWVHHHLSKTSKEYQIIWIPREMNRTGEILGRLLDEMKGVDSADKIASRIAIRAEKSAEELKDLVHFAIAQELIHRSTDAGNPGWDFLLGNESADQGRNGLGKLLNSDPLSVHLKKPNGIVQLLVESLRADQEGRDQMLPVFTTEHFPTEDPEVERALRALAKVDPSFKGPIDIWLNLRTPAILEDAVKICNHHLAAAMQEVMGITEKGESPLGQAFTDYRKALQKEDKKLVLLFEDLAVFGMLDNWIYDLFREGPGTDLAPVRAVFAMTDMKYSERVPEGIKGVETFQFKLGTFDLSGESDHAISFAARWLNVGRTGKEALKEQMQSATKAKQRNNTWFKNYCDQCPGGHKDECHEAFSSVNGIGLYPFNKTALESALKRTEQSQVDDGVHLTPRSIMLMLRTVLEESEGYLSDGSMPGGGFDAGSHLFQWELRHPQDEIAPRPKDLDEAEWRRVLRTRVIWADQAKESEGIRRAFGLNDLEAPVVTPDLCKWCGCELSKVGDVLVDESGETTCDRNTQDHIHQTTSDRDDDKGLKHDNSKVHHLTGWGTDPGRKLIDRVNNQLRTALYEAVKARVNFQWLLVAPTGSRLTVLLDEVLHKNSFNIENSTGAGHPGLTFNLEKSDAVTKLLISALWLDDHRHWRTDQPALLSNDPEMSTWEFPYKKDVEECQVLYEDYVSARARDVEEELKRRLEREPSEAMGPVDVAVVIATSARRCLGADLRPPDEDAEAWNKCVAFSAEGSLNRFSEDWQPIAEVARECLKELGVPPNIADDLAAAHQGTGRAQALDVGTTRELAGKAWANPMSILDDLNDSLDHFPDLQIIHSRICAVLSEEATKNEVDRLLEDVEWLLDYLGETEPVDAADEVFAAGSLALDQGQFQPPPRLREFRDEAHPRIVELAKVWSLPTLKELREKLVANRDSEATAFDLLGDSEKVVQFRSDWEVVRDCLGASLDHVQLQIGGGGSDDGNRAQAAHEEVATGLEDVATLIPEVFEGDR